MESLLDFARGPLFRFTFVLMMSGLLRILVLDIWGVISSYRKAGDKVMPWGLAIRRSLQWFAPVNRVFNNRPAYSVLSILFHVGLILVPVFLYAHVLLWERAIGVSWPTLPKTVADILTVVVISTATLLFIARMASRSSSFLSRKQDYLWPLLLMIPFASGFVCANLAVNPPGYRAFMLIHILSAELIFVLIPFTKIAHCVLMPLSQLICCLAWKFPPETDDDICTTLNKKGAPV